MKMKPSIFLAFILCVGQGPAVANEIDGVLNGLGFKEQPIPTEDALSRASRSGQSFAVQLAGGRLVVKPVEHSVPDTNVPRARFQAGSIRYEGTDRGEWGGQLVAVLPGGERKILLKKNIIAILPGDKHLLVFSGLAHLGLREGAVYRVDSPDQHPRLSRIALLPDAPVLVVEDPRGKVAGQKIIIGSSSLMTMGSNGQSGNLKVLAREQFWWPLFPNSAVLVGNHLVIGLRSGLTVITMDHTTVRSTRYFVPRAAVTPGAK